jgi:hypothetical protein
MLTGRYPWGAGFYDMSNDDDHCTTNSTALPELLKPLGYKTHALGKWDVGFILKKCTPTYRGFDTFFGYYYACEADYWYHAAPNWDKVWQKNCSRYGLGIGDRPTDLSNSSRANIRGASLSLNGTYNTKLIADEAARLVTAHTVEDPFYMYLAFMAVHGGCTGPGEFFNLGQQAPIATVNLYNTTVLDNYKVAGAMYTELDRGIETVIAALKAKAMWENTVFIFVSDNGGPLDHCTNEPLRGGKHTFFEGGVRVMSFVSGPLIPAARRGTRWAGMAASADWYATIPVGIANGPPLPPNTGYRPPDALNLWSAIMDGSAGPRQEVVHQVENQWSCDVTQPNGGCVSSIRMGEMKLIIGGPGDSRTVEMPVPCIPTPPVPNGSPPECPIPFGKTGGALEAGTDHARANGLKGGTITELSCKPWCLFNLTSDIGERSDLGSNPAYQELAHKMAARLRYHASTGPMPAFIWQPSDPLWIVKRNDACVQSVKSGFIEPIDLDDEDRERAVTLLD